MMKNKSRSGVKKAKTSRKSKLVRARKKGSPAKKRSHVIRQPVNSDTETSARVKESIDNYNKGDTMGFATVDEIWKFAESDQ
jgi:hypothetical protein